MYSSTSTITLNMHEYEYEYSENKCTRVRVRLLYNILEYEYDYFTSITCYSPLHFGFRRVLFTSAFSSILKMLALIVATEIQLFLNENHVRFPRRVHEADVNIATRHLAIILTEF